MMMQLPAMLMLVVLGGGEFTLWRTGKPPIVVRATGQVAKEVTVGKPLPVQSAFGLKRGDILSLLDGKGVRILKGPGILADGKFLSTGPPTPANLRMMAVTDASDAAGRSESTRGFSLSRRQAQSSSAKPKERAAVKAASASKTPRQVGRPWTIQDLAEADWLFDVSGHPLICLPEGARPVFYRRNSTTATKVDVQAPEGRASFNWEQGQHVAPWPVSFSAGPTYAVGVNDAEPSIVQIIGLATGEPAADRPFGVHQACASQVELNARVREEDALRDSVIEPTSERN